MVIDWLAVGVNPKHGDHVCSSQGPGTCRAPFIALHDVPPLGWLEQSAKLYKDMQENLKDKDLSTYGFASPFAAAPISRFIGLAMCPLVQTRWHMSN